MSLRNWEGDLGWRAVSQETCLCDRSGKDFPPATSNWSQTGVYEEMSLWEVYDLPEGFFWLCYRCVLLLMPSEKGRFSFLINRRI